MPTWRVVSQTVVQEHRSWPRAVSRLGPWVQAAAMRHGLETLQPGRTDITQS